jgi:hypothetical protein
MVGWNTDHLQQHSARTTATCIAAYQHGHSLTLSNNNLGSLPNGWALGSVYWHPIGQQLSEKSTFVHTDQSVPLITSAPDEGCRGSLRMVEILVCIDGADDKKNTSLHLFAARASDLISFKNY